MLSIAHSLTGAFIASKLPNPALYVPLSLAAHYAEDYLPHWDVGTGIGTGKRKRSTAFFWEIFDLLISLALIYLFFGISNYHVWIGAFFCLLPDFLEAPRTFLKLNLLPPLSWLHKHLHTSVPNMFWGLLPQVLLVTLIYFLR